MLINSVENSWNSASSPAGDLPWKSGSPDQKYPVGKIVLLNTDF